MGDIARGKWRKLGLFMVVLVGLLVRWSAPAAAGNAGSNSCGGTPRSCTSLSWYPNGLYRMYIAASVGSNMVTELQWQMGYIYTSGSTHMEMSRTYSATSYETWATGTSAPSATYVAWVECQIGSPTFGGHPLRTCAYQNLYVNDAKVNFSTGDPSYLAAIACHEIGHTVGLRHSLESASCLRNPATGGVWSLTAHDTAHLRAFYS